MLIKCKVFVLVSGEKDHHAAEPNSAKHVPLLSFLIFFLLVEEGEIDALF